MPHDPEKKRLSVALSAGTALTSYIVGGLVAGYFLDKWLGTAPWLLLAGITLGTIGAFVWLYRAMSKLD